MSTHAISHGHQLSHSIFSVEDGLKAGLYAGITFIVFEMLASIFISGDPVMPFRMMASVPLATEPTFIAVNTALTVGALFHLAFAVLLGVVMAWFIGGVNAFSKSKTAIILTATAFGILLWIFNFYVFAPALGYTWFTESTNPLLQALWHAVAFGSIAGIALTRGESWKDALAERR